MKKFLFFACCAAVFSFLLTQTEQSPRAATTSTSPNWQPVPIVSAEIKAKGFFGGEGAQWVRSLAVDSQTGNFMLWGTDVGGIFRSLNGGKSWETCNVGYGPRGTSGIAIDPHNSQRVLVVAANSSPWDEHGLYLSENQAASWRPVFKAKIGGNEDMREQIAFDPSSYDSKSKMTRTVFWSRIKNDKTAWGQPEEHPALYKSVDGGQSWQEIPNSAKWAGGIVRFHPQGRALYVGNESGLHVSKDGGKTWKTTFTLPITGLDISRVAPDSVWLSTAKAVFVSRDSGDHWQGLDGVQVLIKENASLKNVKVAPGDAKRLILWREGEHWQWPRFYSHDGGANWHESKIDGSLQILPTNARQGLFAFHPQNANIILSTGGDYPSLSRDGGKTFVWTGDGVNNIMVGGGFNFNAQNPDVLFIGSQDYNGASTQDGGKTWTYHNPSGNGWGGFTYGGYALSPRVMAVGVADGWGGARKLTVSRDGGKTWVKTEHLFQGLDIGLSDPRNPQVAFVSNLRTTDGGQNWQPMPDCSAVFAHDDKALYGTKHIAEPRSSQLLTSHDSGATWRVLGTVAGHIQDIAAQGNRIFFAADDALYRWEKGAAQKVENLAPDQWGNPKVTSVAIDPQDPNVIYHAGSRNIFSSTNAVGRSVDGGKTWQSLMRNRPLDGIGKDGGREGFWVRVHPRTREAWVATSCYGIWKFVP